MGEQASPLSVIRANGRSYLAIGDLVNMLRDMATSVDSPECKHSAAEVLRKVAASLTAAAGDGELYKADPPDPTPCLTCNAGVHITDRLAGGTVVLDGNPTTYGRYMIAVDGTGRQVAFRYDVGKHARVGGARFREHSCRGTS